MLTEGLIFLVFCAIIKGPFISKGGMRNERGERTQWRDLCRNNA